MNEQIVKMLEGIQESQRRIEGDILALRRANDRDHSAIRADIESVSRKLDNGFHDIQRGIQYLNGHIGADRERIEALEAKTRV